MTTLLRTPLYDWHAAHGGRMVDFAGWSMPVQYGSIVAEHQATRAAAGLFDVSHMGRLTIRGPGAAAWLDRIVSRRVADMQPGQVRYALVCNQSGGILDDVLVYRLDAAIAAAVVAAHSPAEFLVVVNASNREKIIHWFQQHLADQGELQCSDRTHELAMIAVQGPAAGKLLQPLVSNDLAAIDYYHAAPARIAGQAALVSRTGYTGEDGYELMLPPEPAVQLWTKLLDEGEASGARAAGLGARDTLRLEAAMPLYGHELNEDITPLEAGLGFAVGLKDRDFIGRDALARQKREGLPRIRIGLELAGKRVPREHYPIEHGGRPVGQVTSGTFSPTLSKPLAMGYVPPHLAEPGGELTIDIRGQREPARIVSLPFYRRTK